MNVSPITYNRYIGMKSDQPNQTQKTEMKKSNNGYKPLKIGAIAGVGCFGAGVIFDRACSYLFNLARSIKTSLAVNAIVGAGIGIYTYLQASRAEKKIEI